MKFRNAVIVDGVRSPFSWGGRGMFEATRLDEVAAKVVRTLMERNPKVKPTMIEDFGIGNAGNTADLVITGRYFPAGRIAGRNDQLSSPTASAALPWRPCSASPWPSWSGPRIAVFPWAWNGWAGPWAEAGRRAAAEPCDRNEPQYFREIQTPAGHGRRSF